MTMQFMKLVHYRTYNIFINECNKNLVALGFGRINFAKKNFFCFQIIINRW